MAIEKIFLASLAMSYKKTEGLWLASTPPQWSDETVVQYRTNFEKFLAYVDVFRDLDYVIDDFITGIKTTLVGGVGLF